MDDVARSAARWRGAAWGGAARSGKKWHGVASSGREWQEVARSGMVVARHDEMWHVMRRMP
eukprot:8236134-Lingulodinium_polyedra.AAC.1